MSRIIEHSGWLLDLYEDPLGGLTLWFLRDDGMRCRLRQRFPVTFYAAGPPDRLRALEQLITTFPEPHALRREQRRDVFARREIPVLVIEVQRPGDLAAVFRRASRAFPDLYFADADLPLSLRYAAATGVAPLGRCRITLDSADFVRSIVPLDSPWDLDPLNPPLRVLTLEPDTNPAHAQPRMLLVGCGSDHFRLPLSPIRPFLVNLRALLDQHDPDLLLTSWGDTWLLPRLLEWSETCSLPLPLNRDPDARVVRRKERWYFSYGQIVYRGEQVHLFGRWHVDRKNAMLWSDYDLDGVLETTRVIGLPFQTAARVSPGTGISAIQMLTALRLGVLVPWQKQQVERPKPAADLFSADQGGLVYQPIVGVHKDVAGIDFISMYPAIMVYCNISPETIGSAEPGANNSIVPQPAADFNAANRPLTEVVPALSLTIDRSDEGLVPRSLRPLLEKRVALKQRMSQMPAWDSRKKTDKRRASALKWLLVTCFGYLGYKNARFGRIEAHQAVTAYGREALLQAKEAAEDLDFEILQMYVDGLWVRQEGKSSPEDFDELLALISERSGLPIALDGIYRWIVFLPSRTNPNRPVANRYFGVFQSGEIKMRGIAARRHDTPRFIARAQVELIETLASTDDPRDALPEADRRLSGHLAALRSAGKDSRLPLEDLLIRQRITREVDAYRSPSPAARAARQLQAVEKEVKPGQRVSFLFTLGEEGVHAWDLPFRPDPAALDLSRYKTLLLRAAAEVLDPFREEGGYNLC